jgi:hypothetical protein
LVWSEPVRRFGMEYFLFRFDESHPVKPILWFVVILFPLLGPALYCLVVYSRSKVLRDSLPTSGIFNQINR